MPSTFDLIHCLHLITTSKNRHGHSLPHNARPFLPTRSVHIAFGHVCTTTIRSERSSRDSLQLFLHISFASWFPPSSRLFMAYGKVPAFCFVFSRFIFTFKPQLYLCRQRTTNTPMLKYQGCILRMYLMITHPSHNCVRTLLAELIPD